MMTFCFDWGGALESNESLRQLARRAYDAGHRVYVIPSLGIESVHPYERLLDELKVPHHGVYRVYSLPPHDHSQHAWRKFAQMQLLGATHFFDDFPYTVSVAAFYGIQAHVVTPEANFDAVQV